MAAQTDADPRPLFNLFLRVSNQYEYLVAVVLIRYIPRYSYKYLYGVL